MTSNYQMRDNWGETTPGLNKDELRSYRVGSADKISFWLSAKKTKAELMKDVYLFPNIMSDALAARVPPVVLVTGEFDFYRHMTREARDLYKRNGTLLHYIEFGGGYHASYNNFLMKQSDVWFKDFAKLTEFYL